MTIDYKAQEAFVKNNRQQFDALMSRFEAADASLSADEVAQLYFASPFAGYKPLIDLTLTANQLYKIRDYRVAYFMYRDALVQDPCSMLVLKKAGNCSYFEVIDRDATKQLRARLAMLQDVVKTTGDGLSPETAFQVVQTSDAYQYLWDVLGAKDVAEQKVVKTDGNQVTSEFVVSIRDEKEPRSVFFTVYGETEADREDFFIRKKGF